MRLFVSEFICGGGWPEPVIEGSLADEGRAMLNAVVEDLANCPETTVCTTWDVRLGPFSLDGHRSGESAIAGTPRVEVALVRSPTEERRLFERLANSTDATLLIAPEFDDILGTRCEIVERLGRRLLGPGSAAARLCGDKLALADHFHRHGIPTPSTHLLDWDNSPSLLSCLPGSETPTFPIVVKPRNGAGSQSTFLVNDADHLRNLANRLADEPLLRSAIWQPFFSGEAVSVAVMCHPESNDYEALPVARQILSDDGRFRYQGGRMPLRGPLREAAQDLAVRACRSVPGLRGYVGVDLLIDVGSQCVVVVEINPRLTTSYLGYRQLVKDEANCGESRTIEHSRTPCLLAQIMTTPPENRSPLAWGDTVIEFTADRPQSSTSPALDHRCEIPGFFETQVQESGNGMDRVSHERPEKHEQENETGGQRCC